MITNLKLTGLKNGASTMIGAGNLFTPGNVFYVSSVLGSNGNRGLDPAFPMATVDYAIGACTANNGDIIVLMPGHAETVTATSIALDVAGVSIIGFGNGLKRPTFTFGAAAATITVSAANCSISNCHFIANFADVAAAFTLGAAKNFSLENSTFKDAGTNLNFFNIVVTNSTAQDAQGLSVIGNNWHNIDALAKAFISILGDNDDMVITDNEVVTGATGALAYFLTSSTKIMLNLRVLRNTLVSVGDANATVAIFLTGTGVSTGIVAYNNIASLDTTTELIFDINTALKFFENRYTGVADKSGYLVPAADSAA